MEKALPFNRSILLVAFAMISGAAFSAETESKPPRDPRLFTIGEAFAIAERTGRPIFAVAGSST